MSRKDVARQQQFRKRIAKYSLYAGVIISVSMAIGVIGYHYLGQLSWIDSFYNAAMILTGMGPVNVMSTDSAKIFASFYALFSGIVFLSSIAIFLSPFVHQLMHLLNIEEIEE